MNDVSHDGNLPSFRIGMRQASFWCCLMFVSLMGACLSTSASAHPFHITVGEMEWNAKEKKWEVSVRVQAADLQTAVQRFSKQQIVVDGSAVPDELLKYVEHSFFLSTRRKSSDVNADKSQGEPKKVDVPNPLVASTPKAEANQAAVADQAESVVIESRSISADSSRKESSGTDEARRAARSRFQWVGQETERGWLWLYFELTPPDTDKPLYLTNTLLVEVVEQQINTMLLRDGQSRQSIQTTLQKTSDEVKLATGD